MLPVNPLIPDTSAILNRASRDDSSQEDLDIWFDAIDHVEMEGAWFNPHERHHADPSSSAGEYADSRISFTEDCRRCVQQFVRTLGECGESRMLSVCLSRILPDIPISLVVAANSLYTAITEQRNIDTAVLHTLGLASWYLPGNMNVVSRLADFIRDTVTGWTDETFLQQFLGNDENHTSTRLFTALAVTAIVAGRYMKDEGAPQRGILKVPAFMANIFIRASHYWTALGNMASSHPSGAAIPENTGISQHAPAFEVDTLVEMTSYACVDATTCYSSAQRLTAFSSNSTANPEACTRATVHSSPAPAPGELSPLSVPEQIHLLVVEQLGLKSGLSALSYCSTSKTETLQQTESVVVTATHLNTKCEATANPAPLMEVTKSTNAEAQISTSATGRSGGDALLPLVMTGANMVPVATSYMQGLKSKTVIAAGASVSLAGISVGAILWNKLRTQQSDTWNGDIAGDNTQDILFDAAALQGTPLIKPNMPQPGSGGALEVHSLPDNDDAGNSIRHRRRHLPVNFQKKQTRQPAPDDVKIVKLYDFSCVDEREDLSFSEIIRQIGKTLKNPISSLAEESQVIHSHGILNKGCPDINERKNLLHVTNILDKIISSCLNMLPGTQALAIVQNIIGPILIEVSNEMSGDPANIKTLEEINSQILFMSRQEIAALSVSERDFSETDNKRLSRKISYKGLAPQIILDDHTTYHLFEDEDGNPYVKNKVNGNNDYVYYHKKDKKWKVLPDKKYKYSKESVNFIKDNPSEYYFSSVAKSDIFTHDDQDMMTVIVENKPSRFFVLLNGNLLEVDKLITNNDYTMAIYSGAGMRKNLVLDQDSGWYLEGKSSPISKELDEKLNFVKKYIMHDDIISPLREDGYVYDNIGNKYLKHEDGYVDVITNESAIDIIRTETCSYLISKNEGELILRGIKVSGIEGYIIPLNEVVPNYKDPYISEVLKKKIEENGFHTEFDAMSISTYYENIYKDTSGNSFFLIGDRFYKVKYHDNKLYFSLPTKNSEEIHIYRLNNFYAESFPPEKKFEVSYEESVRCIAKRSPVAGSSCVNTLLSTDVKNILARMKGEKVDEKKLVINNSFPNLFNDQKGKMYFKHGESYYLASIVQHEEKLLNQDMIKIYKRKIFGKEIITKLVFTKSRDGEIFITSQNEQLTHHVKTVQEESNFIYPCIKSAIVRRDEYYRALDQTLQPGARLNECLNNALSGKENIVFVNGRDGSGNKPSENYYPNVFEAMISSHQHIAYASEVLDKIMLDVSFFIQKNKGVALPRHIALRESNYREYLVRYFKAAFKTDDDMFVKQVIKRFVDVAILAKDYQRSCLKIDYRNLIFASSKGDMVDVGNSGYKDFVSNLSAEQYANLPFMQTVQYSADNHSAEKKIASIIIFPEKMHVLNPEHPQARRRYSPPHMGDTFLHEFTHAGADTADYFYIPKTNTGRSKNFKEIINYFDRALETGAYNDDLTDSLQNYCTLYNVNYPENILDFLNSKPYLKSYFIMNNAATYETLFRDISERKEYDSTPPYR
jgi:hypothetical protein